MYTRNIVIFAILGALALTNGSALSQENKLPPAVISSTQKEAASHLVLHLSAKTPVVTPQDACFCLVASIENQGKTPITLIQPGDGSDDAWRTPIVGYSVINASDAKTKHPDTIPPPLFQIRCGNMNGGIGIIKLAPGKQEQVRMLPGFDCRLWLRLLAPGRYRIVFYYTNDPVRDPYHSDGPSPSDPRIRASTPCVLRSNEIVLTIVAPASVKAPQ